MVHQKKRIFFFLIKDYVLLNPYNRVSELSFLFWSIRGYTAINLNKVKRNNIHTPFLTRFYSLSSIVHSCFQIMFLVYLHWSLSGSEQFLHLMFYCTEYSILKDWIKSYLKLCYISLMCNMLTWLNISEYKRTIMRTT